MGFWNRLLGGASQPSDAVDAPPPAARDEFLQLIAREGAWVIAREVRGSDITLVDYHDENGRHVWPLFSSQRTAAEWVRHAHAGVTEATPFPCFQLQPAAVLGLVPPDAHVVFDQRSPYERPMAPDDLRQLRQLIEGAQEPSV